MRVCAGERVVKTYPLAIDSHILRSLFVLTMDYKETSVFLRRCERRKNGKKHTYWALVESYRTAQGSRQRVVAYLGELKASEKTGWAHLGKRLRGQHKPQPSLFDPPEFEEPDEEVLVQLRGIRLDRLRDFGDCPARRGTRAALGEGHRLHNPLFNRMAVADVPWSTTSYSHHRAFLRTVLLSELHIDNTW